MLLNDEYTTMALVVCVFQEVLHVTYDEVTRIMFLVDRNGSGSCGYYSHAEAEGAARQVMDRAREAQYPLRCLVRSAARRHDLIGTRCVHGCAARVPSKLVRTRIALVK